MKKLLLILIGWLLTKGTFAQNTAQAQKTFMDDPFNHPMLPLYFVMALILIIIILVIVVGLYMLRVINLLTQQAEKERAQKLSIVYVPSPGWWQKFTQRINASVPVDQEKSIELDHDYDGIRELDNHLPPWWKWLFYGTIGWAVVYIIVFHLSDSLPLSEQEYQNEIALAEEQARKLQASQPQAAIDENSLQFTHDVAVIEKGKSVYINNNCGACHRNDGGGNAIGPNLTDEYWLYGGNIKNVFSTIKNGVVDKGMPAWGKAMSPEDVRDVAFFIISLQGTKPPEAKSPQGEIFKQPIVAETDSGRVQAAL